MLSAFGNGLELFVPTCILKPGDDMKSDAALKQLSPFDVESRPMLTAATQLIVLIY